ncbi:hypothetical protein GTY60_01045 [Streptomyces sp. SID8367]|nr:hypothetical protein [Streptomyces sp. SID8367]
MRPLAGASSTAPNRACSCPLVRSRWNRPDISETKTSAPGEAEPPIPASWLCTALEQYARQVIATISHTRDYRPGTV